MNNKHLFMKLGKSETANGIQLSAEDTIRIYMNDEKRKGCTWFSLSAVMSAKAVKQFTNEIDAGEVRIIFVINDGRHKNEIVFSAKVNEIHSSRELMKCPEADMYPEEYRGEECHTWLKLTDIREENELVTEMFEITSTGKDLLQVISTSQYSFGYVNLK